jgi:hypothetical protein
MSDDPQLNVAHLITGNLDPRNGLAICGYVMNAGDLPKYHADQGGPDGQGECRCLPADRWPKCKPCVQAKKASDERKRARGQ